MSAAEENGNDIMQRCASCGKAGSDDIKLKNCTACYLVKYCSVKCQKDHRAKHKKECKKRAAELKDEILFKQPESSCFGDCPICCLPVPIDAKYICTGCSYANKRRDRRCPFCRKVPPETEEEFIEQLLKRVEANDPVAMQEMGRDKYDEGDYKGAFEYWTRAAELGVALAHFQLSALYQNGKGVEKDKNKELHHLELAAIGGDPNARYNLACIEGRNGRVDRSVKHFIIAANLGCDDSLDSLKKAYRDGYASKEDFVAALRGYQAVIEATKSPQREEAAECRRIREAGCGA